MRRETCVELRRRFVSFIEDESCNFYQSLRMSAASGKSPPYQLPLSTLISQPQ